MKPASLDAAMRLHQSGDLAGAEQAYRGVLDTNPRDPQALYLRGVVTGQLGRPHEAIELLERAISLEPGNVHAISELAKQLQQTGQLEASAAVLRRLISLRPDLGELHSNLGMLLRRLGLDEEAAVAYDEAARLCPDRAEAHSDLGDVLRELRRFDDAAAAYRRAISFSHGSTAVHRRLAAVLRSSGRLDEAREVLQQWLELEPQDPIARHMLAAHGGEEAPRRASDAYVRSVFDAFATRFDEELRQLDYQGPRLVGLAVLAELGEESLGLDVLDAGCGTGLCGASLRPLARRLVGVDLSAEMLERARELAAYDDLVEGELTDYLVAHPEAFDLIVAADTFNYFGDLEPLLSAATSALRGAGVLVFTLERRDASAAPTDYRLDPHGRYSHDEAYVRRSLESCGLTLSALEPATLRKERGEPVAGIVVRARKAPADPRARGLVYD
jgi:predicted TPR repeat methyltransferase